MGVRRLPSGHPGLVSSLSLRGVRIYLNPGLQNPTDPVHSVGSLTLPRPPIALLSAGAGISNLLSIAYTCYGLGLGPD
jgi:hypothetical protein